MAIITGTPGNDDLTGTPVDDTISGLGGDDTLSGLAGEDEILGGAGDDTLFGEDGDDTLHGGANADLLNGNAGDDVLNGGPGDDLLISGSGTDLIFGDEGSDTVAPDEANSDSPIIASVVMGRFQLDQLVSVENISGGSGGDLLGGSVDDNTLFGLAGNDVLLGGRGADDITGGTGNDLLFAGGNISGDGDTDRLSFGNADGVDRVFGFEPNIDLLVLSWDGVTTFDDLNIIDTPAAGGATISAAVGPATNTITLFNITAAELDADDFILT